MKRTRQVAYGPEPEPKTYARSRSRVTHRRRSQQHHNRGRPFLFGALNLPPWHGKGSCMLLGHHGVVCTPWRAPPASPTTPRRLVDPRRCASSAPSPLARNTHTSVPRWHLGQDFLLTCPPPPIFSAHGEPKRALAPFATGCGVDLLLMSRRLPTPPTHHAFGSPPPPPHSPQDLGRRGMMMICPSPPHMLPHHGTAPTPSPHHATNSRREHPDRATQIFGFCGAPQEQQQAEQ